MGHQRLGKLPASKRWQEVVRLIAEGEDAQQIAAAVARAAEDGLKQSSEDEALRHSFYLLTQIPLAARNTDFAEALRSLGLDVPARPTLVDIGTAMMMAVDDFSSAAHPNDFSEIATKAAAETLIDVASRDSAGLFGPTYAAEETQEALSHLGSARHFGALTREFFGRLTRQCLDYFLSRELANHVGSSRRFKSIKEHDAFDRAIATHCRESSLIVERFAAEWQSKTNFQGGITREKAGGFVHVAFKKMRDELAVRATANA